jgi:hypothetical protein
MQNEEIDMKDVMESRRHAVEESLHTISVAELKALTDELFPYVDHPWPEKFLSVINHPASGTFHHALADNLALFGPDGKLVVDRVHVLYCHDKNIGMWFIRGAGKGSLQPEELMMMRRIVEARPR